MQLHYSQQAERQQEELHQSQQVAMRLRHERELNLFLR